MAVVRHKEAIHSGHFMVSDFEAEAEDEEDLAVPPPEEGCNNLPQLMAAADASSNGDNSIGIPPMLPEPKLPQRLMHQISHGHHSAQAIIDISLNKLFQSMSIAYRQKLTSPKWNRFRGLKLRWKDKIRLNNVIWRCWHMQFIKGRNRLLCAFANPLEMANHNFPEGGTLLEGKYWKRKLQTITKEYMRWRMFYKNRGGCEEGEEITDQQWDLIFQSPFQMLEGSKDDAALEALAPEEDFFVDALFSTLQFDAGPGGRNTTVPSAMNKKTTNSDFIQPCLAPLQPNLDDFFMELDTQSVFSDWQLSKLLTTQDAPAETASSTLSSGQQMLGFVPTSNGNGYGQQFQQQQMQQNFGKTKFSLGGLADGNNSSSNNNMLTFPLDLQSTSVSNGGLQMVMDQRPTAATQQQFLQPQQCLDMPMQQQQGGYNPAASVADLFSYPPQKKLTGPITCTSEKRHSPKHRILHHRDYTQSLESNSSTTNSQMSSISSSKTSTGLLESSSPYKLPTVPSPMVVATATSSSSSVSIASAFLEPRVKTRSYSGPCDVQMSSASPKLFPPPTTRSNNNASSNPNSELVQLLKASKASNAFKQQQQQQPAVVASQQQRPNAFTLPQLLPAGVGVVIPPPPASSAPQPRIEVTPPEMDAFRTGRSETPQHQEQHRRSIHISSEQKRRGSIKNGFELMRSLIPSLSQQSSSAKISKAALLLKGGDYLQQLKMERAQLAEEISAHKEQVEQLNAKIAGLQSSMASSTGTALICPADTMEQMKTLFDAHVERCTMQNWKYWVFSLVMRPLLTSFQSTVKSGSFEETHRTTTNWVDQHLSLVQLRPTVLVSLKELSTSTDVLNDPERLPEEAVRAAARIRMAPQHQEELDQSPPQQSPEFEAKEEYFD